MANIACPHPWRGQSRWVSALVLLCLFALAWPGLADPYPPYWSSGTGTAVHYAPVAWPAESAWKSYTMRGANQKDQSIQDPSNGGTSPQNYVNVSSGCSDVTQPSVYYCFDAVSNVLFFRWRVQQQANTYATGPSAGSFASSDPWKSALWTVLIDLDGDGYREFDVQLDGSSGEPATAVDRLTSYYSNTPSQVPVLPALFHNPSAFVDQPSSKIMNFHSAYPVSQPDTTWLSGSSATVWDYGTTRAMIVPDVPSFPNTCGEYFIDYQIPLAMLDARSVGGPQVTASTPMAFLFATSNSLNNPVQKDIVYMGDFVGGETTPAPFGDTITPDGSDPIQQPIVSAITTAGCGSATLTAKVQDSLNIVGGVAQTTVVEVKFLYYFDANANGVADDGGSSWTAIGTGTKSSADLSTWTISWNSSALAQGQYLIGVQALDNQALNSPPGTGNRTYSYLSGAQVTALGTPIAGEAWYANPASPGVVYATFRNTCGTPPPYVSKSVSPSTQGVGGTVTFTITIHNPTAATISVTAVSDTLPAGFAYVTATTGGTLGVTANPTAAGQVLTWGGLTSTVLAGQTGTLTFNATVGSVQGTYNNTGAAVVTGSGTLTSDPVQVQVGSPRLSIAKAADYGTRNPGQDIVYTITYSNDSPVNVTSVVITDNIPTGTAYKVGTLKINGAGKTDASDGDGATYAAGVVTFSLGSLAAGAGPYTVAFTVTVSDPYTGASPLANTASITSAETAAASATANVFVNVPAPTMQILKDGDIVVAQGAQGTYTLTYKNIGDASASSVVIRDTIPAGFTYVSSTGGGSHSSGVVTWNIGTVTAGTQSSVTVTIQAENPFTHTNPATNEVSVNCTEKPTLVTDSFKIGVSQGTGCTTVTEYFHDTVDSVSPGTSSTGSPSGTQRTYTVSCATADQKYELARFESDVTHTTAVTLGSVSFHYWTTRNAGNWTLTFDVYHGTVDSLHLMGTATAALSGNVNTPEMNNQAVSLSSATLPAGEKLLWVISASNGSNNRDTSLYFDTATYNSYGTYCQTFADLVIDKQLDNLTVSPGSSLEYTIKFSNRGNANATGARIVDTLPTGVTFVNAYLNTDNGTPLVLNTDYTKSGQVLTFTTIKSSDTGTAGQVTAAQSGTLFIHTTVDQPLAGGTTSLTNTASLSSTQTSAVTDSATTTVKMPSLAITKSVDDTSLFLNNTATYTITVLNSGAGDAASVTVTDTLPAATYYTYVAGSAKKNNVTITPDPVSSNVLNYTFGPLTSGSSATITFQMLVGANGLPTGVTTKDNKATVSTTAVSGTTDSNTVTVTINSNPDLTLTKSVLPASGWVPGTELTYSLLVQNTGSGTASSVQVTDVIPTNTTYVAGSLTVGGLSKTDASDGDTAHYDAINNRVVFAVGDLTAASTVTATFKVWVSTPLPNGTTAIPNTGTATASNAASRDSLVSGNASAAPVMALTKTGRTNLAYPVTTLSQAATATTTLHVNSAAELHVGDLIQVAGAPATNTTITVVSGTTLTVSPAVTAANGAAVYHSLAYTLSYVNSGTANATGVTLTDTMPAGFTFVSATPAQSSGTYPAALVWNIGALAPGAGGSITIVVFPNAPGTYTNSATLSCAETAPTGNVTKTLVTDVGGLEVSKSTSTPSVTYLASGTQARYIITVRNTSTSTATGVTVADPLDTGFTYASTESITGAAAGPSSSPTVGDATPTWSGLSITNGTSLTITFIANISLAATAGVHQNPATVTSSNTPVQPFDPLTTTAEDVNLDIPLPVVAGRLWMDENGSAAQDASEPGLANVRVDLYDSAGTTLITSVYTDSNGGYVFPDLVPGTTYQVKVATSGNGLLAAALAANPTYDRDTITTPNVATVTLSTREGVTNANFGYAWTSVSNITTNTGTGAIGDSIWVDANGNGVRDPGEPGLGVATVELLTAGPDGLFGTGDDVVAATTASAKDGSYIFTGLSAGAYVVRVNGGAAPSGYTQTADPDGTMDSKTTQPIILAPGDVFANADFGYSPPAAQNNAVSGTVFLDANVSGTYGGSDTTVPGVTVALIRDVNGNGVFDAGDLVVATSVTNSSGAYSFPGVPDGTYFVWVNDSGSVLTGLPVTADPDSTLDGWTALDLDSGGSGTGVNATGQNFGYAPANQTAGTAMIGDTIFLDRANYGTADAGEGLEGVTVRLYDSLGTTLLATTVTNENGNYWFGGLAAATYVVKVDDTTLPGTAAQLTNTTDPDGSTANQATVTVAAAEVSLGKDFGYRDQTDANTISGTLWKDTNADGVLDGGETTRYAGVTVVLVDNVTGNVVATTTTAAVTGIYTFSGIPDGTYTVHVTDDTKLLSGLWHSTGTDSKADPYTVTVTGSVTPSYTASFGYYSVGASVGNAVWNDLDGDGVKDAGEPALANVVITLTVTYPNNTTITVNTTSAVDGSYSFGNLLLDENFDGVSATHYGNTGDEPSHVITVAAPTGFASTYKSTPDTPGVGLGTDDNADNTGGELAFPPKNGSDTTNDFGFRGTGSIGDLVWVDLINNGSQDTGEPGIPNITMSLTWYGADGVLGGTDDYTYATTSTDGNGAYSFTNLPPGNFGVGLGTLPTGLTLSTGSTPMAVTLTAGQAYATADFPARGTGALGDRIFTDTDTSGHWDTGEGLPSVHVTVSGDIDGDGAAENVIVSTGLDGYWTLEGLRTRPLADGGVAYTVTVDTNDVPVGAINTVDPDGPPNNSTSAVNLTNESPTNYLQDFGYTGAYHNISGTVYWDEYHTANILGTNTPLAGATVYLYEDTNSDGLLNSGDVQSASQVTGAGGTYSFTNYASGKYLVVQVPPSNRYTIADIDGVTNGRNVIAVNLTTADVTTCDFLDSIDPAGYLYDTANGQIVPGGSISVSGPGATVVLNGSTGQYSFLAGPAGGTYTIAVTPPPGYTIDTSRPPAGASFDPTGGPTPTTLGASENPLNPGYLTSATAAANPFYYTFYLESGDPIVLNNNFPLTKAVPGSISGQVRLDTGSPAGNLAYTGSPGLGRVTINLYASDGTTLLATTTTGTASNGLGTYSFTGLAAGNYVVKEVDPTGATSTNDKDGTGNGANYIAVTLTADGSTGNDFLDTYPSTVTGTVYRDTNSNGNLDYTDVNTNSVYDPGIDTLLETPITNVDVIITASNGTMTLATTDVKGFFSAPVPPGATIVDVNTADPDFPAAYRLLTTGSTDPTTVTVTGTGTDNTGYLLGDPTPCYDFHGEANALADGGILATWRTGGEQGVYKFVLERRSGDAPWAKLAELFSTADEFKGGSYRYLDRSALPQVAHEYRVLAVDNDGSSLSYRLGSATATAQLAAASDQRGAPGQVLAASLQRGDPAPVPQATLTPLTFAVASYATDTPVQTGTASRASVAATGLYTVPGADPVYDAGMPLPRLSGNLVFVRALSDYYTDTNVIWNGSLTINGTPGQIPEPPVQGLLGPSGYVGVFHVERNESFTVNQYLPAGPNWYFSRAYELSTGSVRTLAVPVTSPRAGQAEIIVAVRATSPDAHDLTVSVNGTAVGQASWTGSGHYSVKAKFDAALLVNGNNQVALETTAAGSTKRLDYVEIRTPATPVFPAGKGILVRVEAGAATTLTVPGAKYAVDATHFGAEALLPLTGGTVAGLTAGQLLYFCQAPQSLTWSAPLTLDSSALAGQSYVAVAPAAFKTAVAPLVQFHKDQGLNATTITLEDVQNVFGGGWFGPAGLVRLAASVQPRFLLLAAGTTYDGKNYEGLNTPVGIPCGWVQTYDGMAASDDLYTNGFKVAVGRLPVRSATALSAIVAKTLVFDPGQRAVLLAGIDSAVAGYDQFATLQASLAGIVPSTTITSTGRDPAVVRQELVQSIADGGRLVTYQGHGGTDALGPAAGIVGPTVLTGADIPSLPVSAWVLATCLTGSYFVNDPSIPVLSLEMLAAPGAGAVAVICSTRYGDASVNDAVVNLALRRMSEGPTTWGSVLLYLKQQLGNSDTAKVYTLLGDPALPTLQVDDRRITLRSPQTGAAFGRDPVQIRFRLSGQNWDTEKLGVWYRPENGAWTFITEIQVQPGTLEYQWPWQPPGEGRYQIKIEESAGGAR